MNTENANMTVNEITETYPVQYKSEKAFVFDDLKATANPDVFQIPVAQKATGEKRANAILMEWDNDTCLLAWVTITRKQAEKAKIVKGDYLSDIYAKLGVDKSVCLSLTEFTRTTNPALFKRNVSDPESMGKTGAKPKINPTTGEVLLYNGEPIYRNTTVEFGTTAIQQKLQTNSSSVENQSTDLERLLREKLGVS